MTVLRLIGIVTTALAIGLITVVAWGAGVGLGVAAAEAVGWLR
jgi:hypothetical protein